MKYYQGGGWIIICAKLATPSHLFSNNGTTLLSTKYQNINTNNASILQYKNKLLYFKSIVYGQKKIENLLPLFNVLHKNMHYPLSFMQNLE